MADAVTRAPGAQDMDGLDQGFRNASDAKLKTVTGLIDRMPDRGAAEALLAPVRDRLASLRPVRRMNRNRLLFTPFDPLLVRPTHWQPDSFTLPRSVLGPVIALLDGPAGAVLPPPPPFDAADPAELLRCGQPLWDAAATALAETPVPPDWCGASWERRNGISGQCFRDLLPAIAMVLRWTPLIRTLPLPHDPALGATLLPALTAAMRCGPLGWGFMLTLLLDVAPADQVTRLAGAITRGNRLAVPLRAGMEHALAQMLGRLEELAQPPRAIVPLQEPSLLLQRLATMQRVAGLRGMENRPGAELKRVARIEQALDAANRTMFERSLRSQRERFETALADGSATETGVVLAIETDARRLRGFAIGASALEGGRDYQSMLDDLVSGFVAASTPTTAVARLRMVELMVGSERAVQMAAMLGTVRGVSA